MSYTLVGVHFIVCSIYVCSCSTPSFSSRSFSSPANSAIPVNGVYFAARGINLSIVQGSGIGPCLYIVMESDLIPLSSSNILIKYVDDTNLLVPEHTESALTMGSAE